MCRAFILSWAVLFALPQTGLAQEPPAEATSDESPPPIRSNHFVPIFDIVAFEVLLNRFDYKFISRADYDVSAASIRRNVGAAWVVDNDPFSINQFLHPYQGAMYHGFARSAGLNYWEAMGLTLGGSLLWEIAGETTLPSKNDQIASGVGGSFLGEPLFRLAELILRPSGNRFWREVAAAVISPPTGINRLAYGGRFRGVEPSRDPALFTRVQFGVSAPAEAVADFSVEYGIPGKPGYEYHRPFDYFNLQFTSTTGSRFENIFTRGLLAGKAYGEGADRSRGVWGLYGTYAYVSPQIFRVSSVALQMGTTVQRKVAASSALQATLLAGAGYGASGGLNSPDSVDYHYGLTPQAHASVRFVPGDRVAVELTLRDYYVSRYASTRAGADNIARADALFSYRFTGRHAASVRYIWSHRTTDGGDPVIGRVTQSRGSIGLFYTYLGGVRRFGVVEF